MDEFFVKDKALISTDEWVSMIESLKPDMDISEDQEGIALRLRTLIGNAVKKRTDIKCHVGIMFSGGLDSSYIAALCRASGIKFTCYTVGFQDGNFKDPEDVVQAKRVAEFLGLNDDEFKVKIFNTDEIEGIIRKTVNILKDAENRHHIEINNVVNVGVGAVEVAAHSISERETIFFSGLGSEEIFAGYDRHKKNPENEECFQGLVKMYERDLLRDTAISRSLGFSFKTPFLDKELIRYALKIPINLKVNDTGSKLILRKAAYPLLKGFSERPKKAAQYGSSFDRALSKLASLKGFQYKKEYIESI